MAVHFCPALVVISALASLMNRSNSGVPGTASGPRIVAFMLSCSATKRGGVAQQHRVRAQLDAVSAEPVN
jgi:hypothetical protein